ncbi:cell wall hydrolase [Butyrivibrio sp. LC3010]|uniref:cell wall hydrolase n=1 Tax=Butyrivibrio sp. LC3010 TaxID=1280680 RepID=UPI00042743C5|nr:cell wall hydrolase [Butyrivibrio sp. LC3010]
MKRYWGRGLKLLTLGLSLTLCINAGGAPVKVHATEETKKALEEAKDKLSKTKDQLSETKDQLSETKDQLDDKKEDISTMHKEKSVLENKLSDLNDQLSEVSSNLSDLEDQIDKKEDEITLTQEELAQAIITRDEQYAAMKKRVMFIYEKQNFMLLDMLANVGSFANFLNHTNYVASLSAYDRKMLEQYKETCVNIDAKEKELQSEKTQLDEYKVEVKAEQSRVSGLVSKTSGSINEYKQNISNAESEAKDIENQAREYEDQAKEYEAQMESQNADVKALEAKLAEEIRLSKLAAKSKWRNISEVTFAEGDRYLLANLIYCEAGAEPYEGKVAVGAVVINRVLSSVYPDTVVGVIYQSGQFSPVGSGRLALALANGSATEACYQAADAAMSGATNVGNCVYFRTPIPGLSGINIGGHVFY